jgi:flagellar biosynthesis GTPase FlhF
MATDKKHIAVYLDPAVEQALITFCERKELKSKKGTMFSAGVNAALSEFFGISNIEESNTPQKVNNIPQGAGSIPHTDNIPQGAGNILSDSGNIPAKAGNTILPTISNIPSENLVVEVMPGKHHFSKSEVESLRQELEEAKADRAKFLESSTYTINKYRQEVAEMTRSYLEKKFADQEQLEAERAELKKNSATASRNLPEAADLLNQLKARRKKSTVSLADVETLLEIIEKFCDDTPKGL